jgi:3-methyladenine DNA glycosylase/8-oxoguanine DNA glycosylase
VIVTLRPRGPYSLAQSAWGTAGGTRRRRGRGVEIALRPAGRPARAIVDQRPDGSLSARVEEGDPEAVARELREVLLLDLDTTPFRELHADDPLIGAQVRRRPGLRPVCRGTVTQALVAALAGQLITSREASAIEWRIAARAAPACGDLRLPPTRAEIAALSAAELAACGLSPSRAGTLARLVRTLDPESLHDHVTAAVASRLARERGLGAWSAGVAAIWGLGRLDLGLVGDLGLIRLASRLNGRPATAEDTAAVLAPFGAWAGLASLHLLAHPWAAVPVPGGAFGFRSGARWTRRTSPAGPRATPPAPAPHPRTSRRPPGG